jgi:hypothetical protein
MLNRARGYSFRHPMNGLSGGAPPRQDLRGIGYLDLLAKTGVMDPQQHVASLVSWTAHGFSSNDHTIAKADTLDAVAITQTSVQTPR